MIQEVLRSIEGVAIYPIIGLFLFIAGFVAIIVITWKMRPGDVDYVSRLPLDDKPSGPAEGARSDAGRMDK